MKPSARGNYRPAGHVEFEFFFHPFSTWWMELGEALWRADFTVDLGNAIGSRGIVEIGGDFIFYQCFTIA